MRRGSLVLLVVLASLASLAPAAQADQAAGHDRRALLPEPTPTSPRTARATTSWRASRTSGPDTPYGTGGVPLIVDPAIEAQVQPQVHADRELGVHARHGLSEPRAVTGVWGALSKVTGPFSPTIVTEDKVPLLDSGGQPTGRHVIAGADDDRADHGAVGARGRRRASCGSRAARRRCRSPIPRRTRSARCAARPTTSTATTSNGSPIRRTGRTSSASRTTSKPAPTSGTINVSEGGRRCRPGTTRRSSASRATSPTTSNEFFLTAVERQARPGVRSFVPRARRGRSARRSRALGDADRDRVRVGSRDEHVDHRPRHGRGLGRAGRGRHRDVHLPQHVPAPAGGLAIRKITHRRRRHVRLRRSTGEGGQRRRPARRPRIRTSPRSAEPAGPIADLPAGTYTRHGGRRPPDRGGTWSLERVDCRRRRHASGCGAVGSTSPSPKRRSGLHVHEPIHAGRADHAATRRRSAAPATTRFQVRPRVRRDPAGARAARDDDRARRAGRGHRRRASSELPIGRVHDPGDDRRPRSLGGRGRGVRRGGRLARSPA